MGTIDLVIDGCLMPYDIVPLIPIIELAGGVVTDIEGRVPMQRRHGDRRRQRRPARTGPRSPSRLTRRRPLHDQERSEMDLEAIHRAMFPYAERYGVIREFPEEGMDREAILAQLR